MLDVLEPGGDVVRVEVRLAELVVGVNLGEFLLPVDEVVVQVDVHAVAAVAELGVQAEGVAGSAQGAGFGADVQ